MPLISCFLHLIFSSNYLKGKEMLKKELLDILCCPKPECHGDLDYNAEKNTLTCKKCEHVYRVENDIPIMLIEDNPEKNMGKK